MATARGMFDAAKHPRGFHGRFGSGGGGFIHRTTAREYMVEQLQSGIRGPGATRSRHQPASVIRQRKRDIQVDSELARGIRQPANYREQQRLEWASPKQMARQRALTGDIRMPRKDALQRARGYGTGGTGKKLRQTVGTRKTFTGRTIRVEGITPPHGTKPTSRGRFNLAKYGG